ncbi:MAG TPA: tryptophan 2,3-dioxygenase family protein [Chroococcales cyanobacterium]
MTGQGGEHCPYAPTTEYGSGHTSLTYNSYLKVPELKNLQFCQSDPAHHDEPLFIIIHQTYELWFKLILHELDEVMSLLKESKVRRATFFLKRIAAIMRVLVGQIHILETMAPVDFLAFRSHLNPASGFQSSQFREIEITLGLKDERLLEHFRLDQVAYPELLKRFNGPTVLDAFYETVNRCGLPISQPTATDDEALEAERLVQLKRLYENPDEFGDLHDLAEALVDVDEQLALWRTHHVTVVERVIGFKRGTGGSEGVGYLRSTLLKRCFPDLWKVRTVLEHRAG